jgi:hypothetical protein
MILSNADSTPSAEAIYKVCSEQGLLAGCVPFDEILGVSYGYASENPCSQAEHNFYSFTVNILCDEEIIEQGGAVI